MRCNGNEARTASLERRLKFSGAAEVTLVIVADCQPGDTCECHIVRGDTSAGRARVLCGHLLLSFMWTLSMTEVWRGANFNEPHSP